jgi:hypothetical protein
MSRPRLLTPALVERVISDVELGVSMESAAGLALVSARTLRRWRAQGERDLAQLSDEARFALRLRRAEEKGRSLSWQETARVLDQLAAEPIILDD